MSDKPEFSALTKALQQSFATENELLPIGEATSYEELHSLLASHIESLIQNDFEQLIWLLYRVDVNENLVRRMLAENPPAEAPGILSRLLLERMAAKVETRRKWAEEHPDEGSDF